MKWLFKPKLNIFDVVVIATIIELEDRDIISFWPWILLCIFAWFVSALIEDNYWKVGKR